MIQVDRIKYNNQYYDITNVTVTGGCYNEGNIFGTTVAKKLTFDMFNDLDLEKKEIDYQFNVNGNYISMGMFVVVETKESDNKGFVSVSALDYMIKFAVPYKSTLNYDENTITVADVYNEALQQAGVTTSQDYTTLPNMDFVVESDQFVESNLCRDVLQAVAQLTATFATIDFYNEINLKYPSTTRDYNIDYDVWHELDVKRTTHPINTLILGMSNVQGEDVMRQDSTAVATQGENFLIINDNPFIFTQAKREQVIDNIFNKVKGFGYVAYSAKGLYSPLDNQLGDKVHVRKADGTYIDSYIFEWTFCSPKGLDGVISAPSITKATVNYNPSKSLLEKAYQRTVIEVDKNKQNINISVEEFHNADQRLETSIELTKNNILNTVSERMDTKADSNELDKIIGKVSSLEQLAGQIQIDISNISIDEVTTTTGYTFNADGLHIQKTGESISSKVDNTGLEVKRDNTVVLSATNEGVKAIDITVKNYLNVSGVRFQSWSKSSSKQGMGVFKL